MPDDELPMSRSEPMTFPVQYAIPGRQAWFVIGAVFLMIGVMVVLALWLRPSLLAVPACLAACGGIGWWVFSNLHAQGELVLRREGFELTPRSRAFCAPAGVLRIAWDQVAKVQAGVADGVKAREYVILRLSQPRRSLIVIPLAGEGPGFVQTVMEGLNASRERSGKPAVAAADPFSGPGWRVTAGIGLAVFVALLIGAVLNAGKLDVMMLGRLFVVGGFVLVLAAKVFGVRRNR